MKFFLVSICWADRICNVEFFVSNLVMGTAAGSILSFVTCNCPSISSHEMQSNNVPLSTKIFQMAWPLFSFGFRWYFLFELNSQIDVFLTSSKFNSILVWEFCPHWLCCVWQVPRGWDKLFVSIVSVETGKTIAKSSRTAVHGGTCQWTDSFSESIWVSQDGATKELEECLYKIVVAMVWHLSSPFCCYIVLSSALDSFWWILIAILHPFSETYREIYHWLFIWWIRSNRVWNVGIFKIGCSWGCCLEFNGLCSFKRLWSSFVASGEVQLWHNFAGVCCLNIAFPLLFYYLYFAILVLFLPI